MTGVLAGIEDSGALDMRAVEAFVGTSAGAIVAARLAAGKRPRRPADRRIEPLPAQAEPSPLQIVADRLAGPVAGLTMRAESLGGAALRGAVLRLVPNGTRDLHDLERSLERDGGHFDGRLRVVAVNRRSGQRVVFGAPGAPPATVAAAVVASCAIPGYFRPVPIGGREYVDGGAWSQTNLDVAPAGARTQILCLNPIHGLPLALDSPFNAARAALRTRQAIELAVLRRRGAAVRVIGPSPGGPAEPMARDLMDQSAAHDVLRYGYAQGLALGSG